MFAKKKILGGRANYCKFQIDDYFTLTRMHGEIKVMAIRMIMSISSLAITRFLCKNLFIASDISEKCPTLPS